MHKYNSINEHLTQAGARVTDSHTNPAFCAAHARGGPGGGRGPELSPCSLRSDPHWERPVPEREPGRFAPSLLLRSVVLSPLQ